MCGIFGLIASTRRGIQYSQFDRDLRKLFSLSRERGRDASGLAIYRPSEKDVSVLRHEQDGKDFLRRPEFSKLMHSSFVDAKGDEDAPIAAIGHCRLVTHGSFSVPENNQPVISGAFVGVHNGIISNALAIKLADDDTNTASYNRKISAEGWSTESDTRLFFESLSKEAERCGLTIESLKTLFGKIDGSASIAFFSTKDGAIFLATNTGSLYLVTHLSAGITVFASEHRFLEDFLKTSELFADARNARIQKIFPGYGARIRLRAGKPEMFFCKDGTFSADVAVAPVGEPVRIDKIVALKSDPNKLKRCTKCILPETYPYIHFDENGVCNFCRYYKREEVYGRAALERLLEKYRSKDGSPDCVVGLSGGRDSCYGIHVLKNELGMNPVAYTYDWGLTTDKSRINQSKICGRLGIEHIIRAPNIRQKRRYLRKNVHAWMNRPSLGMVPLFVAGDKGFYHYSRQLKKELGIDLSILCSGSRFEQRDFILGFCGIDTMLSDTARLSSYPAKVKAQLAFYYAKEYFLNPSYFNETFADSIWAFFTSFITRDTSLYLFEYLPWNELEIEELLKKEYDWEVDTSYGTNQWRMGDGQSAFTNYIWYTVAGFSEYDNFRAHQIREGLLTRDEALELARADNEPKFETLEYFGHLIGLNIDEILARINTIPKMY